MKIHIMGYVIGFSLLAAGITAIAEEQKLKSLSSEEYQELISGFDRGKDCIYSRTINNWSILDDRRLILYAPTQSRPYFVELIRQSPELKFAHAIGIHSKFDNRLCPYGGNALFIDGDRYTIKAIKKLDKDTAKQLIAFKKKQRKDKKKNP